MAGLSFALELTCNKALLSVKIKVLLTG